MTDANLLKLRMTYQAEACASLFEMIHHENSASDLRLEIDCYYVRFDDMGLPRTRELTQYLSEMLVQYAHTLSEVAESQSDPRLSQKLSLAAARFLVAKKKRGELGEIILWMLLEGVAGVPKVLTKHPHKSNTNMQNFGSDAIHAALDESDGSLILYIGESKLREAISSSVSEVISSVTQHLSEHSGKVAFDQDIYMLDTYAHEDIENERLKECLSAFAKPGSMERSRAKYVVSVFTGYESVVLDKAFKLPFHKIDDYIRSEYMEEVIEVASRIRTKVVGNELFRRLRIVWFVLPFSNISDFEREFMAMIRGEY